MRATATETQIRKNPSFYLGFFSQWRAGEGGAGCVTRTRDLPLTRRLLYQLS
jgi:hypothetical protein